MESTTYLKNLKLSPKKLRFFLPVIKKMTPLQATESLFYSPTAPGRVFYRSIKSAIANAKNMLKVNEDALVFKVLTVEEGRKLKRFNPGGRGTAKPYVKKYSHIKIVLGVANTVTAPVEEVKPVKPKSKTDKKVEKADASVEAKPAAKKPRAKKAAVKKEDSK